MLSKRWHGGSREATAACAHDDGRAGGRARLRGPEGRRAGRPSRGEPADGAQALRRQARLLSGAARLCRRGGEARVRWGIRGGGGRAAGKAQRHGRGAVRSGGGASRDGARLPGRALCRGPGGDRPSPASTGGARWGAARGRRW